LPHRFLPASRFCHEDLFFPPWTPFTSPPASSRARADKCLFFWSRAAPPPCRAPGLPRSMLIGCSKVGLKLHGFANPLTFPVFLLLSCNFFFQMTSTPFFLSCKLCSTKRTLFSFRDFFFLGSVSFCTFYDLPLLPLLAPFLSPPPLHPPRFAEIGTSFFLPSAFQ